MGFGEQSKKDKAAEKAAAAAAAAKQAEEDTAWSEGGKKGNKKQEAAAERAAAKSERKAAADEQAVEEEAQMSARSDKSKKKDKGGSSSKLTRAEIAERALKAAKDKEKAAKKEKIEIEKSGGNDYMGVLMENDNKKEGIDASGIENAIAALDVEGGSSGGGDGKKVNTKALFKAFEEAEIERLRADNPGLKLSQLKERAFQNWQKSPENPKNQEAALGIS